MMNTSPLTLRLSAEALGTFLFFVFGFNAVAAASELRHGSISTLGVALAFGLGLALAITALGHVSGGRFNPAVSLGLVAAGRFPAERSDPVLDRTARRWVRGRSRCSCGLFRARRPRAHNGTKPADQQRRRVHPRVHRHWTLRHGHHDGGDRRARSVARRYGAAPDRPLHLHRRRRGRARIRWLIQPRQIARPGALQPALRPHLDLPLDELERLACAMGSRNPSLRSAWWPSLEVSRTSTCWPAWWPGEVTRGSGEGKGVPQDRRDSGLSPSSPPARPSTRRSTAGTSASSANSMSHAPGRGTSSELCRTSR